MSQWNRMSEEEIDDFLGRGGTGVVAFATEADEPPVAIPVSYGYNADIEAFYFQLSVPRDNRKDELVPRQVSFVVHDETDDGWRSVVATGRLEEISDSPYESTAVQGCGRSRSRSSRSSTAPGPRSRSGTSSSSPRR